jgi:hypothetical protein
MNSRSGVILLFIFLLTGLLHAQEQNSPLFSKPWPADWIAAKGAPGREYGVYLFRKRIELAKKPEKFVIHISADNRYKLYVNQQFVSAGPARGDIAHYNYETLDLSPYLTAGTNIVSVQVWNEAEYRPEAQISLRTGLIVQGDGADEQIINTGTSWKALADKSYKPLKVNIPRSVYYVAGPGELVDMRKKVQRWMAADLDDSAWPAADPITPGMPKYVMTAFGRMDLWLLVPSKLPAMEFTVQRLQSLRYAVGVNPPASFPKVKTKVTIPPHTSAKLLLDQGFLTNAYPTMLFSGGKDGEISISYAESLYKKFPLKGNRNEVADREFVGRRDSIISDGTAGQAFTALFWRTYRYVQIQVTTREEPLVLEDFYGNFTGYPFKLNAHFETGEASLDSIFSIGWRTARLCAFETYSDCPYYEQLQYIGDGRIQALISLYNSGDDRLAKNAMNQIDASRVPEGLTASRHPSYTPQYINTFSLWYIGMLHDYMMYGADLDFVKGKLAGQRQILAFFKRFQDKEGSLKNVPYWSFTDWLTAEGWQSGEAPTGKDGSSAAMDLQLLLALQSAADLERKLGLEVYAAEYGQYANLLAETIRAKYWDANKKLFADRPEKDLYSQHVNTLAILTGLVKGPAALALGRQLLTDRSLAPASIYFKYYLHLALTKAGLGDSYLDWLDIWRNNMREGLTTWAEMSDLGASRSDCHAWGASPNIEFFRTVLGIDSDAPGFAKVKIEPHLGRLKNASGEMPHPKGKVTVDYRSGKKALISLPPEVTGTFIWGGKTFSLHSGKNIIDL